MNDWFKASALVLISTVAGCSRPVDVAFVSSEQVQKLKPELQKQVRAILLDQCGTPQAPRLLGRTDLTKASRKHGVDLYMRYCVQCHGVTGDGNGAAAVYMNPKPRDYRRGIFKFTSTTYGSKPVREDLIRTVRRGIRGTSMPSFSLFSPKDLEAVVDYVLILTRRGEFEGQLAEEAEFNDSIEPARVKELSTLVVTRWEQARGQVVYPATPMPQFTTAAEEAEFIALGKKAFLSIGCAQCHGDDGRGQLAANVGVDSWGNPTKAADLTSGMLRGGTEPLDIYRHIDAGINGTPMPSFHATLQKEPQTIWKLVGYVLQVADSRRKGVIPDSGLLEQGILKPLPGVKPATTTTTNTKSARAGATEHSPNSESPNTVVQR